jgi:hypothetical protein
MFAKLKRCNCKRAAFEIPIRLQIGLLAGLENVSQGGMYKIEGKFDDPSLRRKFYKWKTVFS